MKEALEIINVEQNGNSQTLTIRQSIGRELLVNILWAGFYWLVGIIIWRISDTDIVLVFLLLFQLITVYTFLLLAFGKNTLVINDYEITIKRVDISFIPRLRTVKIKIPEIDKVFTKQETTTILGRKYYSLCLQLKSGEVIDIASVITVKDDLTASTTAGIIEHSLKQFQLPPVER